MALLERCGQMDNQGRKSAKHSGGRAPRFAHVRRAVLKRIRAIAALPVLFALCASGIVLLLPDRYEASVTIQIDARQKLPVPAASASSIQDIDSRALESEMDRLRSGPIVDHVIDTLGLNKDPEFARRWPAALIDRVLRFHSPPQTDTQAAVSDNLTVSRIRNTLLLSIRFSSKDPVKAARIANAIAGAYLDNQVEAKWRFAASPLSAAHASALSQNSPVIGSKMTASERVFESLLTHYGQTLQVPGALIINSAKPPHAAAAPKRKQIVVLAAAAGLVIALALALLLELKGPRRPCIEDVQRALTCPHMTSVPALIADPAAPVPTLAARRVFAEPTGLYAKAIRNACEALERHRRGPPSRLVLVVSALPGEGAELFASNLAHHFAISGSSSLLVDADLRMKGLTRQLAGGSRCGLLDQIASHSPVEDAILRDGVTGLYFLPASGPAPIPLSVPSAIRSPALADAVKTLKERFATIVLSAPPLLPVTDARVLADLVDQIVFVTAWHKTPRQLARTALTSLGTNQRKVAGAVLTDVAETTDEAIMSFADIFAELRRAASFSQRAA
jgi:succinoglycan biosynthesis transport protein ExoP